MVEDAVRQSQQALAPALATLREICEDGEADAQPRISAARSLLEFSIKMTEQLDIIDRLTELEAAMGGEHGQEGNFKAAGCAPENRRPGETLQGSGHLYRRQHHHH